MEAETRKLWVWWLIAAFAVDISAMLGACAHQPVSPKPYPMRWKIQYVKYQATEGNTFCFGDTVVVSFINWLPFNEQISPMSAHEFTHVRQMSKSKLGCRDYMVKFKTDSAFRLQIETEAYCVQAKVSTLVLGSSWDQEVEGVIDNLIHLDGYYFGVDSTYIDNYFRTHCVREKKGGRWSTG